MAHRMVLRLRHGRVTKAVDFLHMIASNEAWDNVESTAIIGARR